MRSKNFRFPVTALAGSRIAVILAKTRRHWVSPGYYFKFGLTTLVAAIFEIFNLWERLRWRRRLDDLKIEKPPVFIVGFWRSGTTLLHNLFSCDPDAAYTTTFQAVFPNVALTQGAWLKPIINALLPEKRPIDNVHMDMDNPQEEEFGLVNLHALSFYNFFIYPEDFDRIVGEELSPDSYAAKELETWKKRYLELIKKSMLNTGGTRYISKNPCNIPRIPLLKEMFPGSKFIFIYRDPYTVVESFFLFVCEIYPGVQLQPVPPEFNREKAAIFYADMMRRYFTLRETLPADDLVEIRMEEFVRDPLGRMAELYPLLGLGEFSQEDKCRKKFLSGQEEVQKKHFEVPEETVRLVNKYAPDILERLGYPTREAR
jgi:hypothetical protein